MTERSIYLTDEQFFSALQRMLQKIEEGEPLIALDSNSTGNKYTECSWGMCTGDPDFWLPDELLWPDKAPLRRGPDDGTYGSRSVDVKYLADGQHCPFDTDQDLSTRGSGCFYRCRVYQSSKKRGTQPTREEAIERYQQTIALREEVK